MGIAMPFLPAVATAPSIQHSLKIPELNRIFASQLVEPAIVGTPVAKTLQKNAASSLSIRRECFPIVATGNAQKPTSFARAYFFN